MLRRIVGTIAGIILFMIVTTVVQTIGHRIWPLPDGVDPRDPAQMAAVVETIPVTAKLWVLLSYLLGSIAGVWAARTIARWHGAGWIVVAAICIATTINILMIPHPLWMAIASYAVPIAVGWVATRRRDPA